MPLAPNAHELELLTDDVLREIASLGQLRKFQKNVAIIQEGDAGDSLYIIVAGKVKVYASDDNGREVVIDIFGPGEYVGEMMLDGGNAVSVGDDHGALDLFCGQPRRTSPAHRQASRCRDFPDFAAHQTHAQGDQQHQVSRADGRLRPRGETAFEPRSGRLGKLRVPEKLTHQEIADRVGSSREMIGRIMKDLVIGGYIEVHDRTIVMNKQPPAHW
jgi:CRP/FNR family cyclic AMP-dependent transcriptional regulator